MSEQEKNAQIGAESLSDERRVKVLSPTMLVMKRFIRNRLAITGLVILIVMFLFSFLGGVLIPYTQSQVFKTYGSMDKDFASATVNQELRYTAQDGASFPTSARAAFVLAKGKGQTSFSDGDDAYTIAQSGEDFYLIGRVEKLASAIALKGKFSYAKGSTDLTTELKAAFEQAVNASQTGFELDGATYSITRAGKSVVLGRTQPVALASMLVFDAYDQADEAAVGALGFKAASLTAIAGSQSSFNFDGADFTVESADGSHVISRNGKPFADASPIIVNSLDTGAFLPIAFKVAVRDAIASNTRAFTLDTNGQTTNYTLTLVKDTYSVKASATVQLINIYAAPSVAHPLGTDNNGMDVLTRLMYGGRVSLMVGFFVVIIELLLGVVVGGVSGYFGGAVDTLLMRFVDLFNCIPYWPMMIIAGAVMDSLEVNAYARISLLMVIMGLLGWTGVARIVRGQILSLREQDFMVATEATGIRASKRIFRHLVPNVMPLLIVYATMNLGSIIITEATLSFLGLGIKYPLASWGSIINSATNLHVMTNYWFIWIPAGFLILLTVLGFNFVGDGLRDAFDPRMKR
jgi:peptide/nickel transport system permease protein